MNSKAKLEIPCSQTKCRFIPQLNIHYNALQAQNIILFQNDNHDNNHDPLHDNYPSFHTVFHAILLFMHKLLEKRYYLEPNRVLRLSP